MKSVDDVNAYSILRVKQLKLYLMLQDLEGQKSLALLLSITFTFLTLSLGVRDASTAYTAILILTTLLVYIRTARIWRECEHIKNRLEQLAANF